MSAREPERLAQLMALVGQQNGQPQPQQSPQPEEPNRLSGELPGAGYLFPPDPAQREQALVPTTPEFVRNALLRAIETQAFGMMMPYDEKEPDKRAHAILMAAQAYLLLDPTVDEQGVPVGAQQTAQAAANAAFPQQPAFTEKTDASGHREPPKRNVPPAAQAIQAKNKPKEEVLKGARGSNPRPRPRIGS